MENQSNASGKNSDEKVSAELSSNGGGGSRKPGGPLNSVFIPPFSLKGWIFFLAGLVPALIIGWVIFPMVLYSSHEQPFNFSHMTHTDPDLGMGWATREESCVDCHFFHADGTFSGIPKLDTCTMCHDDPSFPMGDSEDEKIFLEQYVANDREIPWLIYTRQPDCVYFSHIAHVEMGGMECRTCHGDHGTSDTLPVYKRNRISGYSIDIWGRNISGFKRNTWDRMKMSDCAKCHTEMGYEQNNACFVCHK